jgi:hypothetical protein
MYKNTVRSLVRCTHNQDGQLRGALIDNRAPTRLIAWSPYAKPRRSRRTGKGIL